MRDWVILLQTAFSLLARISQKQSLMRKKSQKMPPLKPTLRRLTVQSQWKKGNKKICLSIADQTEKKNRKMWEIWVQFSPSPNSKKLSIIPSSTATKRTLSLQPKRNFSLKSTKCHFPTVLCTFRITRKQWVLQTIECWITKALAKLK